jgi:hypothetical protein
MTALLASIRPDSWNFPLFLHILGAAAWFGAVVGAVVLTLSADRTQEPPAMRRLAFRSLLYVGLPAYVVMRAGAEWIHSKEFPHVESDPTWIGIGYGVSDIGLLLFLVALTLAGMGARRDKPGRSRAAGYISAVLLVGMVVAVWAMGAKPT